jgi:hypothetical protein
VCLLFFATTGGADGLVKVYDIRVMKEFDVLKGQNSEVRELHECALYSPYL